MLRPCGVNSGVVVGGRCFSGDVLHRWSQLSETVSAGITDESVDKKLVCCLTT